MNDDTRTTPDTRGEGIIPPWIDQDPDQDNPSDAGPHGERVPTGIISLDTEIGGGACPEKLHLVCGYTGSAKSSFASHLAATSVRFGHPVLLAHSEMTPEGDYIPRLISWESGIPFSRIQRRPGSFPLPPWIREMITFLNVTNKGNGTLSRIREQVLELRNRWQATPLVIIDTIDCIDRPDTSFGTRVNLEAICNELARIAVNLKVPVWATTQANDKALNNDVVTMECLRDARGKALPCSLILGFGMSENNRKRNLLTITADKTRDGRNFQVMVHADLACQRFSDLNEAFRPF